MTLNGEGDKDDEEASRALAPWNKGEAIQMTQYAVQLDDESFHLNGKDSQALSFTKTLASYLGSQEQPALTIVRRFPWQ